MELKNFQKQVINDLNRYCELLNSTNSVVKAYNDYSGFIVMIETKGEHLTSNDDSREKAELGKMWQSQAGSKFRYYMVSENDIASNPDATSFDKFLNIIKDL